MIICTGAHLAAHGGIMEKQNNKVVISIESSIWDLGISQYVIRVLNQNGNIQTIDELLSKKDTEVENLFDEETDYMYPYLRTYIHQLGFTFSGEYDELGIDLETANTDINAIGLPEEAVFALTHHFHVYTLGELLTTEFEEPESDSLFKRHIVDTAEHLQTMGYTLKIVPKKMVRERTIVTK